MAVVEQGIASPPKGLFMIVFWSLLVRLLCGVSFNYMENINLNEHFSC